MPFLKVDLFYSLFFQTQWLFCHAIGTDFIQIPKSVLCLRDLVAAVIPDIMDCPISRPKTMIFAIFFTTFV
jgi:hypothetical protein